MLARRDRQKSTLGVEKRPNDDIADENSGETLHSLFDAARDYGEFMSRRVCAAWKLQKPIL
ncbi:hypothetical protein RA28_11090 [Ruegeria sp. ANG-S4]|nr:hypothetical protein RA28_11090 [Ruegeria sp. ANG-S4]